MPWSESDAASHNKKCDTPEKKKQWAATANAARKKAITDGKSESEADASAIRIANAAIGESVDSVTERLQEYVSSAGLTLKVDREHGVIPGVKILGLVSKNHGRTYTLECTQHAVALYEGAKVNVNHSARAGGPRDYRDRLGMVRNVQVNESGLFADFYFNPKHPLAEQLVWDAEHSPENVGFSHVVDASVTRKDGKEVVESIRKVESVDLVADPATTSGLFESDDDLPEDQKELCQHGLSAVSDARAILLGGKTVEEKRARLQEVLIVWQAELAGNPQSINKEITVEYADLTVASLREHRNDLVEQLTGTDQQSVLKAEMAALKAAISERDAIIKESAGKLAVVEADKAKQSKTLAITEEMKAAKLSVAVSEALMPILEAAPDAAARKMLIEATQKTLRDYRPAAGVAPFAFVSDQKIDVGPGDSKAETLARL